MNQVVFVGNITDDPELRYTQSGKAVANFTLAVSHRRWVSSSVDPSGHATSTAKAESQNQNGSGRTASQPRNEDRRRSEEKSNGQWQDVTDGFFTVTCWNSLADNVAASLKKGCCTVVTGRLIQRSFETEGQKRTTVEIVASQIAPDLSFATAEVTKVVREKQRLSRINPEKTKESLPTREGLVLKGAPPSNQWMEECCDQLSDGVHMSKSTAAFAKVHRRGFEVALGRSFGCVLGRGEAERIGISSTDASGLGRRRLRASYVHQE